MLRILGCITGQHDLRFVALAALLCAFVCWTAISLLSRIRVSEGRPRLFWTASSAFVFGAGVWATHFVAMLAYKPAFPVYYDLHLTLLSIGFAVALSAGAFLLAFRRHGAAAGGVLAGLGIAAMHFTGMAALQGAFHLAWSASDIVMSIALGCVLATGAIALCAHRQDLTAQIGSSILLTLGVVLLHFTAMSAVTLVPDPGAAYEGIALAPEAMAIAVTAVAILIVALGQIGALLDQHLAQRRSVEAMRQQAYIAELEATQQQLDLALREARAANEAKSLFLANMSHELRTPLNAIIGFAQWILAEPYGALGHTRYGEYIEDMHSSGIHLLSLINDILDLSRLDAGKSELSEDIFAPGKLLRDACRTMEPQAARAGLKLICDVAPNLPLLKADERRVRQIILNLLSNAVKFTPEKGCVTAQLHLTDSGLQLIVRDTGIGMSKADIPKALEEFGQIDTGLARKYEGTGLGLPLTKRLARLHGADFEIESQPGMGTAITITFPAARLIAQAAAKPEAA